MTFKPHRDSRPMAERPLDVQLEAKFFDLIRWDLTKKQQGRVMGAYRAIVAARKNPVADTKDHHTNGNLDKVIQRGMFHGRIEKDSSVRINWGAAEDYPEGDSILWKLHIKDIDDFIALLTALKAHV